MQVKTLSRESEISTAANDRHVPVRSCMDSASPAPSLRDRLAKRIATAQVPVTVGVSLAVFGLQAIHSILLSRLLGPTGRGEYGTAMFFAQSMIYIGLCGTHYSIARRSAETPVAFSDLQRNALRVGAYTGLASMLIAIAVAAVTLPENKQYLLPLCSICALLLPMEHLRLTAQAVDHGRGKFNRYNLSRLFAATIFPMLVLSLWLTSTRDLTLLCWCTVIVSIVAFLFYWIICDTKNLFLGSHTNAIQLIREGIPDGMLVLANDLYDRFSIFLVIWFVSLQEQGLFLTALPVATLLLVAPNAFELFAFRASADAERRLTMASCLRSTMLVVLTQIIVFAALQLILAPLVLFVFGQSFAGSIEIARIVVLAMAFNGLTIVGEGYLRGRKLSKLGVWTRIVAASVMLLMVTMLSSFSPLMRILFATLAGHIVNSFLVGWLVFRDIRRRTTEQSAA